MNPRKPHTQRSGPGHWPLRLSLRAALRAPERERGTVLLMVVGVLALLAIIGVVYATIGQGDRRAAGTLITKQRISDQVDEVASYLAGVVGDSTFAVYKQPTASGQAMLRTRGYTYPWTDEYFLSVTPNLNALNRAGVTIPPSLTERYARFSPTGTNDTLWTDQNATDARNHADPFLAVLEPEYLRANNAAGILPPKLADLHDWRHISDFAPSGNFVNLANLRHGDPTDPFSPRGGFNAPPGFLASSGASPLSGMSYGLTLFDPTSGRPLEHDANQLVPANPATGIAAHNANPANPADWSNNQVYAFRPAVPADQTNNGRTIKPAYHEYLFNQWADTDGDGFVDSRWFELTDLSDLFGGAGTGANNGSAARAVVPNRGRYRLFVAARCVDNSAMVNVNTASSFYQGPWPEWTYTDGAGNRVDPRNSVPYTRDFAYPPGSSAADIDLARVLTQSDINRFLAQAGVVVADQGYGSIPQPQSAADAANYTAYNPSAAVTAGAHPDNIGRSAYSALIKARQLGTVPAATPYTTNSLLSGAVNGEAPFRYEDYDLFGADQTLNQYFQGVRDLRPQFDLADQLELAMFFGVNNSEAVSRLEATMGGRFSANTSRYSPLRENRPRGLEVRGRDRFEGRTLFQSAATDADAKAALVSVFADVRHLLTTVNGQRPIKDSSVSTAPALVVAPLATTTAREQAAITDISHALQVIQNHFQTTPQTNNSITAPDYANYSAAVRLIFGLYADALMPFTDRTYFPNAWNNVTSADRQRYIDGLCYGGNPELALRMAAHMTANMIDMFDHERPLDTATGFPRIDELDRNEPTILQLDVAEAPPEFPVNINPIPPYLAAAPALNNLTRGGVQLFPRTGGGAIDAAKAAFNTNRLAASTSSSDLRSAQTYSALTGQMTIFGVEPQPFLVACAAFQIYTDAPDHAGGDDDSEPFDPTNPDPRGLLDPTGRRPTIRLKPTLDKGDFVGEVIAFQLHNPFDQEIVLFDKNPFGSTASIDRVKYYLEFSGRFYCFGQQNNPGTPNGTSSFETIDFDAAASSITLKPGQTRSFYVINPGTINQMVDRLIKIDLALAGAPGTPDADRFPTAPTADTVKAWIRRQIGISTTDEPVQLTQVFPTTFKPVQGRQAPSGFAGTQNDMDLWGEQAFTSGNPTEQLAVATPAERHVVHLWRTIRSDSTLNPALAQRDSQPGTVDNDPTNDLLADRMHDPVPDANAVTEGTLYFYRHQGTSSDDNGDIDQAHPGDENDSDVNHRGDNTGFSAITWASFRRPTDLDWAPNGWGSSNAGGTLGSNNRRLRGVLPPWCMEARVDNKFAFATDSAHSAFGMNMVEHAHKFGRGSRDDYITDSHHERFKRLRELFAETSPVNDELPKPAAQKKKNSNGIAHNFDWGAAAASQANGRSYADVAVEFHSVGEDTHGGLIRNGNAIPTSRNPALFSRSGDFLLPLAVGPWFDPSRTGDRFGATLPATSATIATGYGFNSSGRHVFDREAAWMTLSEALALSSGYYSPNDPNDPLRDFGIHLLNTAPGRNTARAALTDRGHPVLTEFRPYLWADTPTVMTVPQPIGSGVPFALGIIDQFRAAFGIASTQHLADPATPPNVNSGRPVMQTQDYAPGGGSLNLTPTGWSALTLRPGFGNINTMPLTPMRALPMVSPEYDSLHPANDQPWMYRNLHAMPGGTPDLGDLALLDYDIAPTIKAYRDRSKEFFRQVGATPPANAFADFLNNARSSNVQEVATDFPADPNPNVRFTFRESLGFKSLGEVALANILKPAAGTANLGSKIDRNGMFRFARDNDWFSPAGAATTSLPASQRLSFWPQVNGSRFYSTTDVGLADFTTDAITGTTVTTPAGPVNIGAIAALRGVEVDHSYQDKLAVVNALTNTASVRSDIFTVYFLIHGYTPEDCDIPDEQPLVPSIAKRYVMVLDRSNVVNPGDKPRVLLLKEVPIP